MVVFPRCYADGDYWSAAVINTPADVLRISSYPYLPFSLTVSFFVSSSCNVDIEDEVLLIVVLFFIDVGFEVTNNKSVLK